MEQFEESNATCEMPTSIEKNLYTHSVHLESNITIIHSSAINSKTWVSRQMVVLVTKKKLISTVKKTKLVLWA